MRFLAAMLVFTQHAISNSHADHLIDVAGFRIGRIGTAVFFLLSGFLAAASTREPLIWLKSRAALLFPAYWLVTIAGFILAGITATKSFDVWQVVSQMAGTGYFTHGDHLVNIATWFMSPLLALYGAVTLIRLTSPRVISLHLTLPLVIAASVGTSLTIATDFAALHCHCVTFFMAFAVASIAERNRTVAAACMAGSLLTLCLFQPEFRYGAVASCLLVPALQIKKEIRICNWFSSIAYEWFLVHGLCLALMDHLTQMSSVIVLAGAALSIIGAMALKSLVQMIGRVIATQNTQPNSDQSAGVSDRVSLPTACRESQRLPASHTGTARTVRDRALAGSSESSY